MNFITTINIGFSIVIALVLFTSYLFFMKSSNKTVAAIVSCLFILSALTALQIEHLDFVLNNRELLQSRYYRGLLFIIPPLFYFFSRFTLFPDYRANAVSILHFVPFLSVFLFDSDKIITAAFVIGTGYCLWLSQIIYSVRKYRKRFKIEFFFFVFFSALTIAVLIVGFSISFIDQSYFYHFYANGITIAYMLITAALIIYPDLLNELTEAVKLGYTTSTLTNIDIEEKLAHLEELMLQSKLYQNEQLNLSMLAETMVLSPHQLSELINTRYQVNVSQYIRQLRINQAKKLLTDEPKSSILSISLETGFKSQSNFYAAFKEATGESPGSYRKSQ